MNEHTGTNRTPEPGKLGDLLRSAEAAFLVVRVHLKRRLYKIWTSEYSLHEDLGHHDRRIVDGSTVRRREPSFLLIIDTTIYLQLIV